MGAIYLNGVKYAGGGMGPDDIATEEKPGAVKPDGTSIEVDPDGTIHSKGGNPLSEEQLNALLALI